MNPLKPVFAILLVVMLMAAIAVPCFAADTVAGTPLAVALSDLLNNTLLPALVVLAGSLATFVLYKLKNWLNLKTSAEFDGWVRTQAEEAVQYTGELAAANLKVQKIKLTSAEKLDLAVASLVSKAPTLTRAQAETLVHAALARIQGEGATGKAVLK